MAKEGGKARQKRRKAQNSTKPVIQLKHHSYQPSVAELNEDMRIDTSPEQLARAMGRQVEVQYSEPAILKRKKRGQG